ncbi:MAG: hypothetical protein KatS3mg103_0962 [Phycisphaerales bacterium]|nr:MAG: hypothetical protein KatS3mg103_0962 [Phycisphaerales bacterium]
MPGRCTGPRRTSGGTRWMRRFPVRRFLDAIQPDVVALAELEVWPNFVRACTRRGTPVAVINGRISDRSFRGYQRLLPLLRGGVRAAGVGGGAGAWLRRAVRGVGGHPRSGGGHRVVEVGFGSRPAARGGCPEAASELARAMGIDLSRPVLVAGSTGPGEEALLRSAKPAGVQLVCAPRRPERFEEAAAALPGCVRRSAGAGASAAGGRAVPAGQPGRAGAGLRAGRRGGGGAELRPGAGPGAGQRPDGAGGAGQAL